MPVLNSATFPRDSWARHYAKRHLETDAAVDRIYYLPADAPEREIRFLEVNHDIMEMPPDLPIDFGVDRGGNDEHRLFVLDLTPNQWNLLQEGKISLPTGWTLDGYQLFERPLP